MTNSMIAWLKKVTRSTRQSLELARLDHRSRLSYLPLLFVLSRGRLFAEAHITLQTSSRSRYRFRYLHRGFVELASAGKVRYTYGFNPNLGRKTALIQLHEPGKSPILAVIDATDKTWTLGQPDLDLTSIFEGQPRVLFKLEYSLQHIHDRDSYARLFKEAPYVCPPIGTLYDIVLDGAYWPLSKHFLDARWVKQQQHRRPTDHCDVAAFYSLGYGDLKPDKTLNPRCERVWFILNLGHLQHDLGLNVQAGFRIDPRKIDQKVISDEMRPYQMSDRIPFDTYLDKLFQSKLLFVPKNGWHKPEDSGEGERTYRLMENLALGLVCLSSTTSLHFPFEPGIHYVEFSKDLSDFDDVVKYYTAHPEKLQMIRQNVLALYDEYLSPIATARYYYQTLQNLSEQLM
jgi:hypothetical protein